jgi:hypothetical protein
MAKKNSLPIILAVLIPIIMIILVSASIYVPRLYVRPAVDFLYSAQVDYCGYDPYGVENGKLVQLPDTRKAGYGSCTAKVKFFIYNVIADKSEPITQEAAQGLSLDPDPRSPDGFEVMGSENNGDYFPFYWSSGDYYSKYLKGKGISRKINLPDDVSGYEFHFLGWINK